MDERQLVGPQPGETRTAHATPSAAASKLKTARSSLQQYRLLLGALLALEAGDRPAPLIVDSYLLRSLAVAGYAVSVRCVQ